MKTTIGHPTSPKLTISYRLTRVEKRSEWRERGERQWEKDGSHLRDNIVILRLNGWWWILPWFFFFFHSSIDMSSTCSLATCYVCMMTLAMFTLFLEDCGTWPDGGVFPDGRKRSRRRLAWSHVEDLQPDRASARNAGRPIAGSKAHYQGSNQTRVTQTPSHRLRADLVWLSVT